MFDFFLPSLLRIELWAIIAAIIKGENSRKQQENPEHQQETLGEGIL